MDAMVAMQLAVPLMPAIGFVGWGAVVLACLGVGFFLWKNRRSGRTIWRSVGISVSCVLGTLFCALCVHSVLTLSFWAWVAVVFFSVASGVFLFWFLIDPILPFVEGPAMLLLLGSGAAVGVCIAISEAAQSQIFSSTSFVTTVMTAVGALYMNKILQERKAIQEMLLPFLSAVVRFRCALSLLLSRTESTTGSTIPSYYQAKPSIGAACFSFELFTFMRAMESKRLKSHYNRKLYACLHDLCLEVKRKSAVLVEFSLQDHGVYLLETVKSTRDYLRLMNEKAEAEAEAGIKELQVVFKVLEEKIRGSNTQEFQALVVALDHIVDVFGFDVKEKSLV